MKFSKLAFTSALLAVVRAQDTTTTDTATDTTTTTDEGGPTVTLAPDVCPTAGLESCYNILTILQPTVYVILTVTDSVPASLAAEETIASGDPILTQSDNIATGTDEAVEPPRTAVVLLHYTESDGTTCDDATTTSTLTEPEDPQCPGFTSSFNTPPPATTKTRVFIKGREDVEIGKDGPSGGGTSDPAPGNTDTNLPVETGGTQPTETAPSNTEAAPTEPTGTTETYPAGGASDTSTSGYDSASDEPTSDNMSYETTDSNTVPSTTDSPTTLMTSSQGESSSSVKPTGDDQSGKQEYTTIAEVTDGTTNYVTKPIATVSSPTGSTSTNSPGPLTGAGSVHTMIIGQVLLGAAGLGVILGL